MMKRIKIKDHNTEKSRKSKLFPFIKMFDKTLKNVLLKVDYYFILHKC